MNMIWPLESYSWCVCRTSVCLKFWFRSWFWVLEVSPAAVAFLNGHVLITSGSDECPSGSRIHKVETRSDTNMLFRRHAAPTSQHNNNTTITQQHDDTATRHHREHVVKTPGASGHSRLSDLMFTKLTLCREVKHFASMKRYILTSVFDHMLSGRVLH